MNKERMLEIRITVNDTLHRVIEIQELISSVFEDICKINDELNLPNSTASEVELLVKQQTANSKAKKVPPSYSPSKKIIYNITKENKTRCSDTEITDAGDLMKAQKKKKTVIPDVYVKLVQVFEDGDCGAADESLPQGFAKYAEKKGIVGSVVYLFVDFVLYHVKKNSKMANWHAAWQTWVRNEIKFHPECRSPIGLFTPLTKKDLGDILEN